MSGTTMRITTEARDAAAELAGDGQSARHFIEELVAKYQSGELVDAISARDATTEKQLQSPFESNMTRDVATIRVLLKLIGNHVTGRTEKLNAGVELLTTKIGECVGCGARMKCPDCGCYLDDHFTEPVE